jgi:hypothetical protein
MHTKHQQLPLCFLGVALIGLGLLGSGEPATAEQRRRTPLRRYTSSDSHHSGSTETVLPGNANSWRPYTNPQVLVTLGMSKAEVLLKAGNPTLEDVVSHGTDGHLNQTVWTYVQTGHNASVATLTFQGNRLARIDVKLNP